MSREHDRLTKVYRRFRVLSWSTVLAVYFLILVGGIVRSTGSGMGCPDWPKCFGQWVPPTEVGELPDNYQDIYAAKRAAKNERLVSTLEALGMKSLAYRIANDDTILEEAPFNPVKTWIEYVNRLIGVLIGLFIIGTFISSFALRKADPALLWISLVVLLLVIFQGWLGSLVVSTNLLPGMVTTHMLLALVIVALLIWVSERARQWKDRDVLPLRNRRLNYLLIVCIITFLIQIVLGTKVREGIDEVALALGQGARGEWIENLGINFLIHRSYSLFILAINALFAYGIWKQAVGNRRFTFWLRTLLVLIGVEIISGVVMAYFAIPAVMQPLHLTVGTLIAGVQFLVWLQLNGAYRKQKRINEYVA